MEPFTIFSLVVASLVLFAYWALLAPNTSKNLPPGPPKLPIIGNIHQLKSPTPHRVLRELAKKYGPIMHLQLGQVSTVVVSTPRLAQEIMKTNDISFADRPTTTTSQIFFYKAQDIGWAPYGEYWRQMKKICTLELLSAKKVRSFSSIREEELTRIRKILESKAGTPINYTEMTIEMVNNVICKATLGDCCKDQALLIELLYDVLKTLSAFNLASYYPRLQFLNVISGKKAKWLKMQKKLDDIMEDILKEHRAKGRAKNSDQEDLVDVLLRVKETGGLDIDVTDEHVKAVVLDMLTAGTDTSSTTLEWAMTELMRNPDMMKRAQEEVRSVVKGEHVTETDLQSLHYLKLIVKETMRLHAPTPLLVPRECRQDCNVDGYDIPAKTKVLVNAWACGVDPGSWENPESFIPERFKNCPINFMGADFQYIPFGAGRRICPGLTFGLSMVEYPLAHFLYHFDWKLPNGMKPHELDITEITTISTSLKHHLKIVPFPKSSLAK
uniref:Costunolide n=1 Tax=Tanacetum cinerariifolium TaxID=118510 RepID=R9WTS9_TANCI|nr:costunolide [Tanacetum cinerariifolium]AXL93710.1 Cytochrome P450 [Tanacetum cinerariifolium]